MKVLITGGHMGPALAVIAALPKDVQVVYVGRRHSFEGDKGDSLEYQTIRQMGIPFISLTTGRLQRVITPHTLQSLFKIPRGLWEAVGILQKEKPDVVVGFGGYISFPVGLAAKLVGIPLVIHEQILKTGMANKILSHFATKICVSWEQSLAFFPKEKSLLTGNPLLPLSKKVTVKLPTGRLPLLAIVGGSAGSHAINELVRQSLPELLAHFRVFHQTGNASFFGDFATLQNAREQLPKDLQERYEVAKFIPPDEVWGIFDKADGVVTRSGINTITMLLVLGKKSLLIPLTFGQKNEQLENALLLEKEGLGMILHQSTATPSSFVKAITAMMGMKATDPARLSDKAQLHLKAAEKIAAVIQLCAKTVSKKEKIV